MTDFGKTLVMDFWDTLAEMSPYLLFGFFVAGLLSVLVSQRLVERHLGGKGIWPLVKASLFGVPLPLCSCGVIPVSMSLNKYGASKGATIAFLLSTPQTGVDSIFVTYSLLGPVFAVFRPVVAFVTGIVGGVFIDLFERNTKGDRTVRQQCKDECCSSGTIISRMTGGLKYGFVTLPRDIGMAMLVGIIVAAFISALVPEGFFAEALGTGIFAMLVMMVLGIPVYVCATASVPVAAALIMKGVTPGAALIFLMTGPATNAAGLVTVWKMLGSRAAIVYLLTVAGCALSAGILLDFIIQSVQINIISKPGWMLPTAVKYVSAVILLTVLASAVFRRKAR